MHICSYGCGKHALYYFSKHDRWCCSEWTQQCDAVKKKVSKSHIGITQPLAARRKLSMSAKKRYEQKENHPWFGRQHTEESKKKIGLGSKDRIPNENTRRLMSIAQGGSKNHNWKGGISKEPYCFEFTGDLKEYIKERDNHTCQNPNCDYITQKLCIHHIDYNKKNCEPNNLITLCISCNGKANFNREYWRKFYSERIKENE